ncbi:hypothetical protein EVAR_7841_1 [Eumeta japonica]|uniref:Uncharacterized protein n=1 Tax=Eumeta variegata TaxID=151549 RepID=A0A4C1TVC7_EUMVA|nr:hypothetical protein EVAR_7841_1 [Eumeta japonica]
MRSFTRAPPTGISLTSRRYRLDSSKVEGLGARGVRAGSACRRPLATTVTDEMTTSVTGSFIFKAWSEQF